MTITARLLALPAAVGLGTIAGQVAGRVHNRRHPAIDLSATGPNKIRHYAVETVPADVWAPENMLATIAFLAQDLDEVVRSGHLNWATFEVHCTDDVDAGVVIVRASAELLP